MRVIHTNQGFPAFIQNRSLQQAWCPRQVSNLRAADSESAALPAELRGHLGVREGNRTPKCVVFKTTTRSQ